MKDFSPINLPRRSWWLVWAVLTLVATAYLIWDAWSWLLGPGSFRETAMFRWPAWVALWWGLPVLALSLQRWPPGRESWWRAVAAQAALLGLAAAGFALLQVLRTLAANHLPWAFFSEVTRAIHSVNGWDYSPLAAHGLLAATLAAGDLYLRWQTGRREQEELVRAKEKLDDKLLRANLDALRMQLHPHFLFNALNSITGLIRQERSREAEDVVAQLGALLRRALDHRHDQLVPLEQELEFLESYFALERLRFPDRLEILVEVAPDCRSALVPSLLLQPLVENAMKHGFARDPSARSLAVRARRESGVMQLEVYNDGPPPAAATAPAPSAQGKRAGIGLNNTRTRLAMLFGEHGRMSIRATPPRGVTALVEIPFTTQSS